VFAYAELDEILRGAGRTGAIGMTAIDGLIAALVAAPSFVHPEEWIPLIFGGRQPNASPGTAIVQAEAPDQGGLDTPDLETGKGALGRARLTRSKSGHSGHRRDPSSY
jgi:hypothetical protein